MYSFKRLKKLSIGFIISVNVLILLFFQTEKPVHVNVDRTLSVRICAASLLDRIKVVAGIFAERLVQDGLHGLGDCWILHSGALQD